MLLRRVKAKARTITIERSIRATPRADLIRLGDAYGGWWVPRDLLDAGSVCYLAGVGEDVTFDLALIAEVGCEVWAMDPTPRAVAHVESVDEPRFHFIPEGLWSEDSELRFYEPLNPAHVSHSVVNAQGTTKFFSARCRSLRSFMAELGHDRVDLLKMDIEGSEVAVIDDMLTNGPLPRVLLVELDAPEAPWKTLARVRRLRAAGYTVVKVEGLNVTFVRQ